MKKLLGSMLLLLCLPAQAALNLVATVPEWAALAEEIGGERVKVFSATTALQDPHRIEARPSLIARVRNADLLLATGAGLEVGWLPVVQHESANPRIQVGQPGYFEAAAFVRLLDAPARLDRADGDVHAAGNPHIQTDPRQLLPIAEALAARLAQLDAANAAAYRAAYGAFAGRWRANLARWEKQAAPLRGVAVVSQHKAWTYLYDWLGLREVATLEAVPGVEPSLAHMAKLRQQVVSSRPRLVIRAAYNAARPAEWFAAEAGLALVVLPFTVGGTPEAKDLDELYESTVRRLLKANE